MSMYERARSWVGACILLGPLSSAVAAATPWPQSAPQSVGVDPAKLQALDHDIAAGGFALTDSMDVFRCARQIYSSRYPRDYATLYGREARERGPLNQRLTGPYNYFDVKTHPYWHGSDLHSLQSITKTVTSITLGIAISRGDFKAGLDTPVLHWFDEARVQAVDARKRRMTLRHVLTMSTGLDWDEDVPYADPRSDSSRMEATDDWVAYTINKPMAAEPGSTFKYSSGATQLLSYIFRRETGQDIEAYAEKHLFRPLGMRHHWKRAYDGTVDTEGGLFLSGADLAKLGQLFLQEGVWQGQRIVAADWVTQSVTPAMPISEEFQYGYKWWLYRRPDGAGLVWMGRGFGGQRLMVFPKENLIATFTGWDMLTDPAPTAALVSRLLGALTTPDCPAGE
jgi:CubicO group peptidase (beta-lactamase class C family)